MSKIVPPLPPGATLDDLNPDLAFSYELARAFDGRSIGLSLEKDAVSYKEVQIGFTKRPAWFPYVSIHTADTDMSVNTSGAGTHGLRARKLESEFAVLVRDEHPSAQLGRARLTDFKYDVIQTLAKLAGGGDTYRTIPVSKVEMLGITPDDVTENVSWGFMGQVLALGTVSFK